MKNLYRVTLSTGIIYLMAESIKACREWHLATIKNVKFVRIEKIQHTVI